jgi:hypothetical protein
MSSLAPYQDPALPTNEEMVNFTSPVAEMMAEPPPLPPRQPKGLSFDFDGLIGKLQADGFDSLTPAQQELLWTMKEGVQYSPAEMASFVQNYNTKAAEQSTPQAQAQAKKAQLEAQKAQAEVNDLATKKQAAVSEIGNMRTMLAELKSHAGMSTSVGAKGAEYLFGVKKEPFAGTKAADFYSLLEQVQGGTFMQAFNNLKGAGQITEQEGAKATAAIARLNPRQSEEGFNKALMDFDGVLAQAQARSQSNAAQQPAAAAPQAAPQQAAPQSAAAPVKMIGNRKFVLQPNGKYVESR